MMGWLVGFYCCYLVGVFDVFGAATNSSLSLSLFFFSSSNRCYTFVRPIQPDITNPCCVRTLVFKL